MDGGKWYVCDGFPRMDWSNVGFAIAEHYGETNGEDVEGVENDDHACHVPASVSVASHASRVHVPDIYYPVNLALEQ